jgi:hypothetical protein
MTGPAAVPLDRNALSRQVDALFAEWDRANSPGAAVGIVQDGELVYVQGYGCANLEHGIPISPTTVFDVASVSKQFTGLSVAMLAGQGALSLDGALWLWSASRGSSRAWDGQPRGLVGRVPHAFLAFPGPALGSHRAEQPERV